MKYIDSEKLIAEIERRIESWAIRGKHSPAGQGRDTCDSRVTELSDLLSFIRSIQKEQPIKVYRVENEKEQKGLWRKFDGTWEPLFDMLTDGQCKDMPMDDSPIYREGGKQWFASAPSKETLQKWFSKRDLEELTAKGFTISEFEVVGHKKVSDFEYIFTRDSIISRTYLKVSDIYPQERPDNMIQWAGNNLKEVIDFTGKSPRFGEWFKSWEEFETYVHQHNDILYLFCEDGSHYEVPVGAWIVKTPDGHNVPSIAKYVQQGEPGLPGYNKALLEVKSKVDELYEEAGIGLCEYDTGLYNGIAETCMKLRGFIKARLASDEQPESELELEKEIEKYCRIYYNCNYPEQIQNGRCSPVMPHIVEAARHFYELGLNARKK